MSDLYWKPCPKCGSKEDLGFACNSPRKNLWVYCSACDVHGPTVPDSAAMESPTEQDREDSENAAVDVWNEQL